MMRRTTALGLALTAAVSLLVITPVAPPAHAATTDLLVGDSVMAGMSSGARSVLPPHIFDARVCRRLISTGCTYNGSRPSDALSVVRANAGRVDRAIVVGAGYNDGSVDSAVDAVVAEARRQGVPHVVWLTYRIAGSYASTYRNHNATLWAKADQHPELKIGDWASLSAGRSDWVASDGLHLTGSGASAMAGLIADALGSLAPPTPTRCDLAAGGVAGRPRTSSRALGAPTRVVVHNAPRRLVDTRTAPDGAVRAGRVLRVQVPPSVADRASAVIATITAVDPCGRGHVTAYACSSTMPTTSTLNPNRSGATANTAVVPINGNGALCLYTSVTTDLVVDLTGHLAPTGRRMRSIDPIRLIDTRPGLPDDLAMPDGLRAAGSVMRVPIRRAAAVGAADVAVAVNVTVTRPADRGYVSVYPGPCTSRPPTSNLNYVEDETIAVAAIARIGDDDSICVYTHRRSHLIVDLTGVIGSSGSRLRSAANVRLVDTRRAGGARAAQLRVTTAVQGSPEDHTGAIVNTVAIGRRRGYVAVRPCDGSEPPTTSTVNHLDRPIANLAVVAVVGDALCVYRHSPADLVVDAVAWLVP